MEIQKFNEFYNNNIDVEKLIIDVENYCANKSDLDVIAEHSSYKKIIKNGANSIYSLLEKIDNGHVIWLRALSEIVGEKPDKMSKTSDIRNFWKKWSIENGY